jgi:hypothetical protein
VSDFALWKARVKGWLPRMPGMYAEEAARRLADRPPPPGREHVAIEDMARAVIRHQLTDYDRLWSAHELTPDEAAQIVEAEVDEWLDGWR